MENQVLGMQIATEQRIWSYFPVEKYLIQALMNDVLKLEITAFLWESQSIK